MNLVECIVTKVLGVPVFKYDYWWLKVKYTSYGVEGETTLMFHLKDEALRVEKGYNFLS